MANKTARRIAVIADSFDLDRGGVAKVAALMAVTIKRAGYTADFLSVQSSANPLLSGGLRTFQGSPFRLAAWLLLHRNRFSHVLFDSPNRARLSRIFPAITQTLTFIHGIEVWEQARPDWIKAVRRSQKVISNSHYTAERAAHLHAPFPPVETCWLATLEDTPAPNLSGHAERAPIVLSVARMAQEEDYKGHRELIDAWNHISGKVPGAELHFVGDGSLRPELEAMAKKTEAPDSIHFLGKLSSEELERAYRSSRVFAMPSRGEGFGLVYIEAMRFGLPVIASIHDAAQEIVEDHVTGRLVDLDSPSTLSDALLYLLLDPAVSERFGQEGQNQWMTHFRFSAFEARFLKILQPFLGESDSSCAE